MPKLNDQKMAFLIGSMIVLWGLFLGVGSMIHSDIKFEWERSLIIVAFPVGFAIVWFWLLKQRQGPS